jgi:hypothetical protein
MANRNESTNDGQQMTVIFDILYTLNFHLMEYESSTNDFCTTMKKDPFARCVLNMLENILRYIESFTPIINFRLTHHYMYAADYIIFGSFIQFIVFVQNLASFLV